MLGEFIFQGDVYEIKTTLDTTTPQDHLIKFKSLKEAQFFFSRAASDPFTREELLEVAQWLRPTICRAPANCPRPTEEALLDELCLQVFKGDLILVIIKLVAQLTFKTCCVDSMKRIERIVDNTKLIGPLLCIAEAFQILASHTKAPALISALSSAYNAKQTNWTLLAEAMLSLSALQRQSIFEIAKYEVYEHNEREMNRELGKYWKGIMDAAE
jgi:hypothetical protein